MYDFYWDKDTRGYQLTMATGKFVANEIRPVFAEELNSTGLSKHLVFDTNEKLPLMWARQTTYLYQGQNVARLDKMQYNQPIQYEWLHAEALLKLTPVDIPAMIAANAKIMSALVADTLKRIKEMYDRYSKKCNAIYIGFSGGKDSVVLLDLCHRVLPLDIPVVFSDTDMELPDTYKVWEQVQSKYRGRPFIKVSATTSAIESWREFGPPSQFLRWCCSVHKSTPAILALQKDKNQAMRLLAFVGVRGDESLRRAGYDDIGDGFKSKSQVNAMPILSWSAHELFLYLFENDLILNAAYRKGIPRVGCALCPMSSDRQNALIQANYPGVVQPFIAEIRQSTNRIFSTQEDEDNFIFHGGWGARKSGVSLKNIIHEPGISRSENSVRYDIPTSSVPELKEWMKTIGRFEESGQPSEWVLSWHNLNVMITFDVNAASAHMECRWNIGKVDRTLIKWITNAIHKAMSCIGCRACEASCPAGALKIFPVSHMQSNATGARIVHVDAKKCIHCMNCHSPQDGCLRYFSKRYAGGSTMNIKGINKYMTFGLQPEWIAILASEGANFRDTASLGTRMVPAAVAWFREAGLIESSTAIVTTPLIEVGKSRGFRDLLFWRLIWVRLANISPLIKWYICTIPHGERTPLNSIDDKLAESVTSASVRKGALQSLCAILKSSPIGSEEGFIKIDFKGRNVTSLTRRRQGADPLVILYGIYVMADVAQKTSFTIREMLAPEFENICVSPLAIFDISVDDFKSQCLGLSSKYPDFLSCNFSLGLDEIRVHTDSKNVNDVIALIRGA